MVAVFPVRTLPTFSFLIVCSPLSQFEAARSVCSLVVQALVAIFASARSLPGIKTFSAALGAESSGFSIVVRPIFYEVNSG